VLRRFSKIHFGGLGLIWTNSGKIVRLNKEKYEQLIPSLLVDTEVLTPRQHSGQTMNTINSMWQLKAQQLPMC